jgi:hypothetical protein
MAKVAANLAALRTLRDLQEQDRPATADEQAVLARWSGWGAVPKVFDESDELVQATGGIGRAVDLVFVGHDSDPSGAVRLIGAAASPGSNRGRHKRTGWRD